MTLSASLSLSDIVCLSEKRRTLLLLLKEKGCKIEELTEKTEMTAHSLAPQLKTLRDEKIIVLKDDRYELTHIGHILVKNMYPLFETIAVLERDRKYWFDRDLSVIPPELLYRIGEIGAYKLLEYSISDYMFDVPAEFLDNLKKSKHAMCLLSVYHPVYTDE
ncbi:hypothetical protein [Methanolapillus millepedarum]|uniref:HVO-A0261-like N-terminal domain-containing protein n=1 Tax=Methanolapillus millepedarum TaxID=3028296 RepID=A0AA96VC74_9EURY|nr:hypothetical protein MsAc7_10830 [Methanosarcinaceae archaeon Ac7]